MPRSRRKRLSARYEQYPSGTEQWVFDTIGLHGPSTEDHLMKESYTFEGERPSKRGLRGALGNLKKADLIYELDGLYHLTSEGRGQYWDYSGSQDLVEESNPGRRSDMMAIRKVRNAPMPHRCPTCKGELEEGGGYVGETLLYCPNKDCERQIVWEDSQGAMSRII